MDTLTQLPPILQTLLIEEANNLAHDTGWIERQRKWSGAQWVQTLVFGWMSQADATLSQLQQTALKFGVKCSEKNLSTRLAEAETSTFLQAVLQSALSWSVTSEEKPYQIVHGFKEVVYQDSTVLSLPAVLREQWNGGGNQHQKRAAMKINTGYSWLEGNLQLSCHQGVDNDRSLPEVPIQAGGLLIHDSGFFNTTRMVKRQQQGVFTLTRVPGNVSICQPQGGSIGLAAWLSQYATAEEYDEVVLLTHRKQSIRILARRLPPDVVEQRRQRLIQDCQRRNQRYPSDEVLTLCQWVVLATTAPADLLSFTVAFVLYRSRWQIELLFKLWKQHGHLDEWRTDNIHRIQAEIFGKLLALLVMHWFLVVTCWGIEDRSLVKALRALRQYIPFIICAIRGAFSWSDLFAQIAESMTLCRINKRRQRHASFQLFDHLLLLTQR